MATEYKGLTITFNADTRKFNSALREARSGARGITTELKLLEKGLKIDPTNTDLLARKQDVYRQKIQATRKELEAYKTLEAQASKQNNGAGLTSEQWTKLKSDIAITTQRLKEYERALEQMAIDQQVANSSLNKAGVTLTTVGTKLEGASAKAGALGTALTNTVTKGMAIAGGASVVAATKIDTSLTNVKKTVDGTAEDYQKLKKAAIEFSQTNAVSASQILDIESLGAQLGYTLDIMSNGKSEVQEFGEVVSGLDIATNMDAETAGTELAQFFNIMQIGKEQTENYASAIVDLGNKNATTESAISAMALRIAGAGKQIGLTGADVLGLATALTSLGIEAEMGGTAISTIMSQIDKSVALNNDALKTWAETAQMSTEDFVEAWKSKPTEALNSVLQGMNSAVESGGNMAVMLDDLGISSLRQTDVMKRLAGGGETLAKAINISNTAWQENTALSNEVANRNDSLSAKFEMLKNQVIAVAEQIGKPLADALLSVLDAGKPLFDAIASGAKAFSEMSKEEQQTVLATAGVIAAAGPLLKVMGNTSDVCKKLGSTLSKMSNYFATLNVEALRNTDAIADNAKGQKILSSATSASEVTTKKATLAQKAHTLAIKAGTTAMRLFKVALPILAITATVSAISSLAEATKKTKEQNENLTKINKGLKDTFKTASKATNEATNALGKTTQGAKTTAKSFADLSEKIDKSIESASNFVDCQNETWAQINGNADIVSGLIKSIETLTNRQALNKDEQNKLASAVEQYNSITGDTIEIIDITRGKISKSTEDLKLNTKEWQLNAEAQALQEATVEIYKNLNTAEENLTEAQERHNKAVNDLREKEELYRGSLETNNRVLDQARLEEIKTREEKEKQQSVVDGLNKQLNDLSTKQGEVSIKLQGTAKAFQDLMSKQASTTGQWQNWEQLLESTGINVSDFCLRLQEAGVKTSDLRNLSDEQLRAIAEAYQINIDSMKAKMAEFGIQVPQDAKKGMAGIENAIKQSSASEDAKTIAKYTREGLKFDGTAPARFAMLNYENTIGSATGPIDKARVLAERAKNKLSDESKKTTQSGYFFGEGFVNGIKNWVKGAVDTAKNLATSALNALKGAQQEGSPSKITTKSGKFFAQGFAIGIAKNSEEAQKNARLMAEKSVKAVNSTLLSKSLTTSLNVRTSLRDVPKGSTTTHIYKLDNLTINGDEQMNKVAESFIDQLTKKGAML